VVHETLTSATQNNGQITRATALSGETVDYTYDALNREFPASMRDIG
jgi:hypothetical protein